MAVNVQTGPFVVTKVTRKKSGKAKDADEKLIADLRA